MPILQSAIAKEIRRIYGLSRTINNPIEELEVRNWYNQRVNTTKDQDLKEVMAHNRNEEVEHASMNLGWLRWNMDGYPFVQQGFPAGDRR